MILKNIKRKVQWPLFEKLMFFWKLAVCSFMILFHIFAVNEILYNTCVTFEKKKVCVRVFFNDEIQLHSRAHAQIQKISQHVQEIINIQQRWSFGQGNHPHSSPCIWIMWKAQTHKSVFIQFAFFKVQALFFPVLKILGSKSGQKILRQNSFFCEGVVVAGTLTVGALLYYLFSPSDARPSADKLKEFQAEFELKSTIQDKIALGFSEEMERRLQGTKLLKRLTWTKERD